MTRSARSPGPKNEVSGDEASAVSSGSSAQPAIVSVPVAKGRVCGAGAQANGAPLARACDAPSRPPAARAESIFSHNLGAKRFASQLTLPLPPLLLPPLLLLLLAPFPP